MKLNYETCIVGQRCVLVPYRPQHVARYHEWMQDASLLEATGSEPLSVQEEYEMQQSWRLDDEKCTFIVLAREKLTTPIPTTDGGDKNDNDEHATSSFVTNNLQAMAGDVNLFLSKEETVEDVEEEEANGGEEQNDNNKDAAESPAATTPPRLLQAEVDIMIAEPSCRKMGLGREAVCLMMLYGIRNLGIRRFFCKINQDNEASLRLFGGGGITSSLSSSSSSLGFEQCDYAECFRQYEYELKRETVDELDTVVTALLGTSELQCFSCPCTDAEPETTTTTRRGRCCYINRSREQ